VAEREETLGCLEQRLAGLCERFWRRNEKRVYIDVPPEHSLEANRIVFDEFGGRLATATGKDTRDRIEVLYHYCLDARNVVVTIRTWGCKPDPEADSVAQLFPGANFIEREMQDLLGIKFRNHPDPRRLILADDWPQGLYPLRRDYPDRGGEAQRARLLELLIGSSTGARP
jgi:Ni,Fe-hydrogenase III component G